MEKTIVRWYFDSDPRGTRVFYRVISNVPAEVKNTNETYMTTTPLEETKSFNIRQALDQQEISSFFELVHKEELRTDAKSTDEE